MKITLLKQGKDKEPINRLEMDEVARLIKDGAGSEEEYKVVEK